jgi:hypothetical protein
LRVLFIYVIIRPNRLHFTQSLFWSRFSRHHDSLIRVACGSQMQILLESPFYLCYYKTEPVETKKPAP